MFVCTQLLCPEVSTYGKYGITFGRDIKYLPLKIHRHG